MKRPVRTVESKHGDAVVFDFTAMTITHKPNDGSEPDTEHIQTRREMWRKLRETRDTFADPTF